MALVMGTIFTLGVSLIVAMAMEDTFVTQFLSSAKTSESNVIDFHNVLIFEEQSGQSHLNGGDRIGLKKTERISWTKSLY